MAADHKKRFVKFHRRFSLGLLAVALVLTASIVAWSPKSHAATQQSSGSIGVEGTIPSTAPTSAPTITFPGNGQSFGSLPVRVAGLCTTGLLVEVFKNGVLAGSVQCVNGSYSIQIDLFSGTNELIARVYDSLNQASPDSNKVIVTFDDGLPGSSGPRVSITTEFAKRGANPGEVLTWPVTISGGVGPYAVSVDWGDKTAPDLISRSSTGQFNLQHTYEQSGIYNIIIKVTDGSGRTAFLQVVGISNGPIQQTNTQNKTTNKVITKVVWWPLIFIFPLVLISFWLGRRSQLQTIRGRIHRGERPIK